MTPVIRRHRGKFSKLKCKVKVVIFKFKRKPTDMLEEPNTYGDNYEAMSLSQHGKGNPTGKSDEPNARNLLRKEAAASAA